jgi:hypothetical protein
MKTNPTRKIFRRSSLLARLIAYLAASLIAGIETQAVPLYTSVGSGFSRDDATATVGVIFTADSAMVISELGFIDNNLDGNNISHQVGLWTSTGILLGSVTIPSGTSAALIGQFRYEPLATPIPLINGSTYILGSYVQSNSGDIWQDTGVSYTLGLPVSNVGAAYSLGSFSFPTNIFPGTAGPYIGPNMIEGVPDTGSTFGLLSLSLMALFGTGRLRFLRVSVITLAFPILTAHATSIAVPNFSFESPALPNGSNNNGGNGNTTAIPGWTISAPASSGTNNGVYHPSGGFSSTNPLPAPADGNQIAYLFPGAAGATCSITTTNSLGTIVPDSFYTLTVALGNRSDNLFFDSGTYTIDILANGVSVGEATLAGNTIAHGSFVDLSTSFFSGSGSLVGESLTIELSATAGTSSDEGIFDNVRLSVPESGSTCALLFLSLMIVLGASRCRSVQSA